MAASVKKALCQIPLTWRVLSSRSISLKSIESFIPRSRTKIITEASYDIIRKHGFLQGLGILQSMHDGDALIERETDRLLAEEKKRQSYNEERVKVLGEELSAAHFILARGGAVKFYGNDRWIRRKNGSNNIPDRKVDSLYLEAIDASGTDIIYEGLENFIFLERIRYLNVSGCPYFDDFCMNKLHILSHSLECLDITGCPEVTEKGLICLHHLEYLQIAKIENLPKVKDLELTVLSLEELLPKCRFVGIDQDKINELIEQKETESLGSGLESEKEEKIKKEIAT